MSELTDYIIAKNRAKLEPGYGESKEFRQIEKAYHDFVDSVKNDKEEEEE